MTRRRLLCVGVVIAAAGCGGSGDDARPPTDGGVAATQVEERSPDCVPGSLERLRSPLLAYAGVVATSSVRAYARPGGRPLATFGRENANGVPTVFGVLAASRDAGCERRWLRVQLPRKPNGIVAWVRARDVDLVPIRTRIEVDLSERRVEVYRSGRRELVTTAAVGSSATPTPTGDYYVDQRLLARDPSGPYGPGAVGIAAYSEVLTGWAQGGPIAIHGTNQPWSIGQAVSNGCLRVRNAVLRKVFAAVLPGTPVSIRP